MPKDGRSDTSTTAEASSARVLCITMHYAPEELGTAPVITPLVERLAKKAPIAEVITARPYYPDKWVRPDYAKGQHDNESVNGVQVRRCATRPPRSSSFIDRLINESLFCWGILLCRLTGRAKPARHVIAVCPTVLSVFMAPLFRARHGRLIAIVHDIQSGVGQTLGYGKDSAVIRLLRVAERVAFNRADELVVLSEDMKNSLKSIGVKRRIHVLPPQVDCQLIVPQQEPRSTTPMLLYSGNLGHKQGLSQLLDLAECLERRHRNFELVIRGEGSEGAKLSEQIAQRGLRHVSIQPLIPRQGLSDGLAQGIVHLVPQLPQGAASALPSKMFSIMAAGRPFVCTANPDSLLAHFSAETGCCLCAAPFDAEAFADAVESLLDDPQERHAMGQRGRAYAETHASAEIVLESLCRIILDPPDATDSLIQVPTQSGAICDTSFMRTES